MAGARPRIRLVLHAPDEGDSDRILFKLVASQVDFEGIHFELEAELTRTPSAIFSLEDSQATWRRCSFFQITRRQPVGPVDSPEEPAVWVARLDSSIGLDGDFSNVTP